MSGPGAAAAPRAGGLSLPAAIAVAFGTGFAALAFEILWFRVLAFANLTRPWTFGALLGAYLLGVAVGSRECSRFARSHPEPGPRHRAGLAFAVLGGSVAAFLVVPTLAALAPHRAWPAGLALVAVAAGALGAALPLTAHLAILPDDRAGARLSYVYLADIVGCALGGTVTGYLLLDWLPLAAVNVLLGLVGAAIGLALAATAGLDPAPRRRGIAAGLAALAGTAAVGPALHDRLWERLKFQGDGPPARFAEVVENRHGVVAVTADGVVLGGGVYDCAFSTDLDHDRNGIFRAYAVAGIHPAPRRVLFIGLGSGSWAQVLANLPGVEALTVVEINPGYLEIVRRRPEVASVLGNPRVELVIDDARRWLRRHPERTFDLVISNASFHWREHATVLLSIEFARLVKSRLAPDGVYFFNTTGSRAARDTALAAFANGLSVGNFFAASDAPLSLDLPRLAGALEAMRIDGRPVLDPAGPGPRAWLERHVPRPPPLEARQPGNPIITDDNMLTEWLDSPFSP